LTDVRGALLEARRVLKPSGRLLVTDHSGPDDPEAMDLINKVSKLRDGSHGEAPSPGEWRNMLADVGFDLRKFQHAESHQDMDALFEAAGDIAPRIEKLFENAPSNVLEAIGYDGSDPAGFTSVIVVFDAESAG
jgi:ubiquinone/menaquinone biosynthesis C-methylase UbiE